MSEKRIIIIGRGRGRWHGYDADGEKWTMNYYTPRVDVLFDIHQQTPDQLKHQRMAAEAGQKVITQENYPLQEIIDKYKIRYFGNTICYMIALAMYQGAKSIDLYGCNIVPLKSDQPIVKNHYGTEFWLGYAMGSGLDVKVHGKKETYLLREGMYGYDWG